MDLPRGPVAFFDTFRTDTEASRPVPRMVDTNIDVYSPKRHGSLRGQRRVQREKEEFILCATCKHKTVFKRDRTAIEPAQCIVDANSDDYEIERRLVRRGEGLKQCESIRFALCASCMSKTVYAKRQAAKYAARGHSGQRRADKRPDVRRGQGTKAHIFHLLAVQFIDEFA